MRDHRTLPPLALALLAPLALGACADETADQELDTDTTAVAPAPRTGIEGERFEIQARNQSGLSGEGRVRTVGDTLTITMALQGSPGAGEITAHVHRGACGTDGPVVAPLRRDTTGTAGGGAGMATTDTAGAGTAAGGQTRMVWTVATSELPPAGGAGSDTAAAAGGASYSVMAHRGGQVVLCGDLPATALRGGAGPGGTPGDTTTTR